MRSRPLVTVHVAQSLDGRIALGGRETALSTSEGRRCAHAERAAHDAVLVGASTIRIDDPRLTVRDAPGPSPLRVVLASALDLPRTARVVGHGTLVVGARGRARDDERAWLAEHGVDVEVVRATDEGLAAIDETLDVLAERGVRRLLVEGGARVLTSFFRARAVARMNVEIGLAMLGAQGTPLLGALALEGVDEAPALEDVSVERVGANVLVRGRVVFRGAHA